MEFRNDRLVFGLLVLLFCAIVGSQGADRTPSRTVVELVSVTYKPARIAASETFRENAPVDVQHAKAEQGQPSPPARAARTSASVSKVLKVSCRPAACRGRTPAMNARKPEPPLPAVFVPIRRLGLYLQARLGTPQHGKAAEKRKR